MKIKHNKALKILEKVRQDILSIETYLDNNLTKLDSFEKGRIESNLSSASSEYSRIKRTVSLSLLQDIYDVADKNRIYAIKKRDNAKTKSERDYQNEQALFYYKRMKQIKRG